MVIPCDHMWTAWTSCEEAYRKDGVRCEASMKRILPSGQEKRVLYRGVPVYANGMITLAVCQTRQCADQVCFFSAPSLTVIVQNLFHSHSLNARKEHST